MVAERVSLRVGLLAQQALVKSVSAEEAWWGAGSIYEQVQITPPKIPSPEPAPPPALPSAPPQRGRPRGRVQPLSPVFPPPFDIQWRPPRILSPEPPPVSPPPPP
ncbi:hypothetical protein BDQ12DRAFT_663759 [Crucibulum laeve]|uniref:Uncharacterized protein n=1 Tax=Crucibulum laeve TaxID=68775 RepID=A0A5C3MAG0_9AGAR|nr:hypothetical protein BDQ12DRAFT_663759 [Crucibulum laeve]